MQDLPIYGKISSAGFALLNQIQALSKTNPVIKVKM
jgi:hypothetical protein